MLAYLFHTNPDRIEILVRTPGVVFFAHGAQTVSGWFDSPAVCVNYLRPEIKKNDTTNVGKD